MKQPSKKKSTAKKKSPAKKKATRPSSASRRKKAADDVFGKGTSKSVAKRVFGSDDRKPAKVNLGKYKGYYKRESGPQGEAVFKATKKNPHNRSTGKSVEAKIKKNNKGVKIKFKY